MIRILAAAVLAALALAPEAPRAEPVRKAAGDVVVVDGIRLPRSVAGIAFASVVDNEPEHPGLGKTIRFRAAGPAVVTAYVYDAGLEQGLDGTLNRAFLAHFDVVTSDVFRAGEIPGYWKDVELVDRYWLGSPDGGRAFVCAEFRVVSPADEPLRSLACLSATAGRFVKVRFTLPDPERRSRLHLAFLGEIAALNGLLLASPDGRDGAPETPGGGSAPD